MDLGKHVCGTEVLLVYCLGRLFSRALHCITKEQVVCRADPNLSIPTVQGSEIGTIPSPVMRLLVGNIYASWVNVQRMMENRSDLFCK